VKLKEIVFTALYSGYSPIAPGTAGTVVALLIYVLEYFLFGQFCIYINIILVFVLLYPAIKVGDAGERFFGVKDPSGVVFDEVMGYWISVMFHPFNWIIVVLAFFIFRFMDILKPFPAKQLQKLKGGWGIMIDDYIAGLYTNIILFIIVFISRIIDLPIY
jgi:phosphatidylglycerophosphatase A